MIDNVVEKFYMGIGYIYVDEEKVCVVRNISKECTKESLSSLPSLAPEILSSELEEKPLSEFDAVFKQRLINESSIYEEFLLNAEEVEKYLQTQSLFDIPLENLTVKREKELI